MQAIVFPQAEAMSVERVDDPPCAPDEVIVQVAQCGICGTDVHIYHNEYMSDFPLIPGHEFAGTVVEVGSAVRTIKLGDRVAVDPNLYCGACDFCRNEQANHCSNWQGIGITRGGGFAQFVAAPARACYLLPEGMSDQQASFIEPLACVVHALKRFRPAPGDSVLLFGAGPMGLLLIQALRNNGASRVVVVDKQPDRLALAQRFGAVTVQAGPDAEAALRELSRAFTARLSLRRGCHGRARCGGTGLCLPAPARSVPSVRRHPQWGHRARKPLRYLPQRLDDLRLLCALLHLPAGD